jgi:DNA primase
MIDQSTVDRIFDSAQIMDVVQDYITLKRRGTNYLGICPFHNEKTPSFTVSPAKNIYKCFGCGKGGNPVNFVMEHEKISYYEALKFLAKRYNIEIVESQINEEDQQQKTERESMMIVSEYAGKFFANTLLNTEDGKNIGLSYFKERGFREDTIKKFELGFSPLQRDALTKQAQKDGYKLEFLVKTGLTVHAEGHTPFDRFGGRVMFPIHNLTGKVIAFGGRIMTNDKKMAKYLNSPESEIYHKSNVLYGIYQAKQAIIQQNKCILVEGYTDVISMHQAGIENVVASSGTSLTVEQIRLIKRFTSNVTILYDGDPAGIKASIRGIDLILEEGLNVRVILLPQPEDPDSFARNHSITELNEYLQNNETDFIHFKTNLLLDEVKNDPIKKAQAISDIVKSISIVPDAIIRSVFIRECSKILTVDEKVLYFEVNKQRLSDFEKKGLTENHYTPFSPQISTATASTIEINEIEVVEKEIIRIMLNYGQTSLFELTNDDGEVIRELTVQEYIVQEIQQDELEFSNDTLKIIYCEFQHFVNNGQLLDNKYFIQYPDADISRITADIMSESHKYELRKRYRGPDSFIETEDMHLKTNVPKIILKYKLKRVELIIRDLQLKLLEAQNLKNIDEILSMQNRLQTCISIRVKLSKEIGIVA